MDGREGGAEVLELEGVRGVGERREVDELEPEEGVVAERLLGVGSWSVSLMVGSAPALASLASLSESPSSLPFG